MPEVVIAAAPTARSAAPREVQVLLCCARTHLDWDIRAALEDLLHGPIAWEELLRLAARHHVTPLVHHALKTVASDRVPSAVGAELSRRRAELSAWNLRNIAELFALQDLFTQRGVTTVPLKGPALVARAYGDISLRPSSDIDLLLRPEHLEVVHGLLQARGYRLVKPASPGDATEKDRSYLHTETGLHVEIHWRVSTLYRVDRLVHRALNERLDRVPVLRRDVPILPLETLFVVLCVHGAHHRWERLKWVSDIAELLRGNPVLDGLRLLGSAREGGCERVVELGVFLAVELLGARIPPGIKLSRRVVGVGAELADRLASGEEADAPGMASLIAFHGALEPSWTRRGRVVAHVLHSATTPRALGGRNTWRGRLARTLMGWARPVTASVVRRLGE